MGDDGSWLTVSPSWDKDYDYRIKPKVKRWRWVLQDTAGGYFLSYGHYTHEEVRQKYLTPIQKIRKTEIEK